MMDVREISLDIYSNLTTVELYTALVIENGEGAYRTDGGTYEFRGSSIVFISPFQTFQILKGHAISADLLQFHGDFYCIEFHKPEVACNGLLFNNVYLSPTLAIEQADLATVRHLLKSMSFELATKSKDAAPDTTVLISYLQLFLALSSRIKKLQLAQLPTSDKHDPEMEEFRGLIEKHFLTERSPTQYADKIGLSPNQLSKRSQRYFSKTPSELIQERVVLEAKKLLHLTRKSVKEVSFSLNFDDEHYFSRFFKKSVGLSPQAFRDKAGISIVADSST